MKLTIRDLAVSAVLGIYPEEQAAPREFVMTIELEYDAAAAIAEDDFAHAVDYAALETEMRGMVASRRWNLIETLAHATAKFVVDSHDKVALATVTIDKPQAMRYAASVAATATYIRER